ncbi:hypothetical protein L208DRAFT_1469093, partial [Tricholoma matsutake]
MQSKQQRNRRRWIQPCNESRKRMTGSSSDKTGHLTHHLWVLSSKSKPDLQEIAGTLSLAEKGTKEVLLHRINSFFDSHPCLCNSKSFTGLFSHAH